MPRQHAQGFNAVFLIAIFANAVFVIVQIIAAQVANSTGLLSDAIHNLGDVLSLILAFVGNKLLQRTPTVRSTYGLKKTSILAAFANGALLIFSCGIIVTEAMYQFFAPNPIKVFGVMFIAGCGIIVNGVTAALFIHGRDDLNIRAAFLHLIYDALISVSVLISAILIYFTGWLWLDPVTGLLIAAIILNGTWRLFTDSFHLMIDGVPRAISINNVRELLERQKGVHGVHDLHIWALSTRENALSVHLWMPENTLNDSDRETLAKQLREEHGIQHITIQVERSQIHCGDNCEL